MDLWTAAVRDDPRQIELCLAGGGTPDLPNPEGDTALLVAAGLGRQSAVRVLLERGARTDARDRHGRTALMRAAEVGQADIARLLVEAGADVRLVGRDGESALAIALNDPLGWGRACSDAAEVIASRFPPEALRLELGRLVMEAAGDVFKNHDRTIASVNESVVRLRSLGIPGGLDVSERERLTMFLDDVVRHDREVRELLEARGSILDRIAGTQLGPGGLEEIRVYLKKAKGLATTVTQLRMEGVVLDRLTGP